MWKRSSVFVISIKEFVNIEPETIAAAADLNNFILKILTEHYIPISQEKQETNPLQKKNVIFELLWNDIPQDIQ